MVRVKLGRSELIKIIINKSYIKRVVNSKVRSLAVRKNKLDRCRFQRPHFAANVNICRNKIYLGD